MQRPSLENEKGGTVCTLQLLLSPVLCLEAFRVIGYNIGGHQSTFCSMITKEYIGYQLVVVDIKESWGLKCLRTLEELTGGLRLLVMTGKLCNVW